MTFGQQQISLWSIPFSCKNHKCQLFGGARGKVRQIKLIFTPRHLHEFVCWTICVSLSQTVYQSYISCKLATDILNMSSCVFAFTSAWQRESNSVTSSCPLKFVKQVQVLHLTEMFCQEFTCEYLCVYCIQSHYSVDFTCAASKCFFALCLNSHTVRFILWGPWLSKL